MRFNSRKLKDTQKNTSLSVIYQYRRPGSIFKVMRKVSFPHAADVLRTGASPRTSKNP